MHVSMIGTIGRVLTGLRRYVGAAMAALVGGREAAIVQEPWAGDIGVAVALSALYCAPISCFAGCVSTPRVRFRRWALAKKDAPPSPNTGPCRARPRAAAAVGQKDVGERDLAHGTRSGAAKNAFCVRPHPRGTTRDEDDYRCLGVARSDLIAQATAAAPRCRGREP